MTPRPKPPALLSRSVARRVRELREQHSMTVRELAEKLAEVGAGHLDRAVLTNLETERRQGVTVDEVAAFAEVFGVTIDFFLSIPGASATRSRVTATRATTWVTHSGEAHGAAADSMALKAAQLEVLAALQDEQACVERTARAARRLSDARDEFEKARQLHAEARADQERARAEVELLKQHVRDIAAEKEATE